MKVILLEDIKNVGKKGQILDASDGYARNFLLPKKLAVEANKANLNELDIKKKAEESKKQKELEEAKALGKRLEEQKVTIQVKTGEGGKLFGSVTNKEVAAYLEKQLGIKLDKKKVVMPDSIKTIGEKTVEIKLHPKVTAKVVLEVVEQK